MYEFVTRNKRFVQILLALMMVPFALVGVDWLRRGANDDAIGHVGSQKISRFDYDNALRDQTERLRQMLGRNFDPAVFDNNEVRGQILDGLVNQRLLQEKSKDLNFAATDNQLQKVIAAIPAFQEDGKFSGKRYEEALRAQGMSPLMFEQQLRQDLALRPLQDALSTASFVSDAQVTKWLQLNEQKREIALAQLPNQAYQAQVNIDDATAKAFYESNKGNYQSPEQVRLEYLILALPAVAAQQTIEPAAVKAAYDQRGKEYAASEERQASHILIGKDVKDAKKKAEELLAKVKAAPATFAELAKANSTDPGSKDQGGDLGYFGRGAMVKPFEDAVYSMTRDEIRGPVESDFGYHIIKLTGIKGGGIPPFDEVKGKIEQDLKTRAAQERFGKLAEKFQSTVFEQSDTFKGFAEDSKIQPISSQWLTRAQVQAIAMGNAKMTQAIFADGSLSGKKNSEAIEIAPNTLMAARVLEHKPAATRPYDDVKNDVINELKRKGAADLAKKAGAEKLALAAAGKDAGLTWAPAAQLARQQRVPGITEDLMKQAFAVPAEKLPATVGGTNESGGYSLLRVSKVIDGAKDSAQMKNASARIAQMNAADVSTAYLASLRTQIKSDVKRDLIEKKDVATPTNGATQKSGEKDAKK